MRFFPPIVTGPIIIAIGLNLSSSAINNCTGNWWIAIAAILIIVAANIWGKGMIKIIPILLGVIGSYLLAVIFDADVRANLVANVSAAKWFALPIKMEQTVFGLFASGNVDAHKLLTAVITIVPLSLATMVEHIGDVSAISSTCNRNYIENPGLHRTLMGDGLATTLAALFGAPANTTYGENTGVLALSRIYDPRVIRIAAVLAMLFSFSPKFAAIISSMPGGTIGGVSLVLYGMISGPHPGSVHRHQLLLGRLSPFRRDQPFGSGCRLHRRHRPERRHARQGLCLRRRQAGRRICQLHRSVNDLIHIEIQPQSGAVPPSPPAISPEIGLRAARLWAARKCYRGENNEEFGGVERRLSRAGLSAYPQSFPRHQTAHRRMVKPYKREPAGLFPFCAFSIEEEFEQDFTNR